MEPNQNQPAPSPEQPQPPLPPQQPPYATHQENPGQTFGIVSLVMIVVFPLLGIVFGAISRSKSKAAGMPTGLGTAGLIINIVLSVLGLLAFILFFVLVAIGANVANNSTSNNQGDSSSFNSSESGTSGSPAAASSVSDFDQVCDGTPISNAAAFSSKQSAIATTFYQVPNGISDSWLSTYVGYNKPYYLQDTKNYTSVSLTACAKGTKNGSARQCTYQSKTVDYYAAHYDVTFYEAKTAKKIGSGGFDETNDKCPTFLSYNTETNSAVASPSDGKYEAAIDSFIAQ